MTAKPTTDTTDATDATDATDDDTTETDAGAETDTGADTRTATTTAAEVEPDEKPANREAAKYRRKLREAEAARDGLAQHVERLQRAEVLRLAGARLDQAADLFDVGRVALADLLNDAGDVEPALVDTAVLGLLEARPGLGKGMVRPPSTGFGQGAYPPVTAGAGPSWEGLLRKG